MACQLGVSTLYVVRHVSRAYLRPGKPFSHPIVYSSAGCSSSDTSPRSRGHTCPVSIFLSLWIILCCCIILQSTITLGLYVRLLFMCGVSWASKPYSSL